MMIWFGASRVRTEKSIVSKRSGSSSSCASSSTHVFTPCIDFSFATWLPDDVIRPLNTIFAPVTRFVMSDERTLKCSFTWSASILSRNSGMMETSADVIVYRVNRMFSGSR